MNSRRFRRLFIALPLAFVALAVAVVVLAVTAATIRPITHCGDMRRLKAAADVSAITEALESFRLDHARVPTTQEGLAALVVPGVTEYLLKVPVDPWGNPYVYASDGRSYSVASLGADGTPGGHGADADVDDKSPYSNAPNKPLQPTRAAQPNGQREAAGSGPRG